MTPTAAGPGWKPLISQGATSGCWVATSGRMACIMAWKDAVASSSEMFLAMAKPSHHRDAEAVEPPLNVGAAARTVCAATSLDGLSGPITEPAYEPQPSIIATLPAR